MIYQFFFFFRNKKENSFKKLKQKLTLRTIKKWEINNMTLRKKSNFWEDAETKQFDTKERHTKKKKEENNLQNKICSPFSLLYQHPLCINMISLFFKS